jgi:DNA mismatch endonuclease (patch repair protein)
MRPRHEREGYKKPSRKTSLRMRAVRQIHTPGELRLRSALWRVGLRYRTHRLVGKAKPDLVFRNSKVVVFVDGCFWHGCPVHYKAPVNNADFWRRRLETNRARDRRNDEDLTRQGWRVLRYWECDLRRRLDATIEEIRDAVVFRRKDSRRR